MEFNNKKDIFGQIFFVISVLMLVYMIISPLNTVITHIDEYFTMTMVNLPFSDLITVAAADVHPPLYYLMGKIVAKLTVFDLLYSLRLLSIIPYVIILFVSLFKIKKEYGWFTAGLFPLSLTLMSEFLTHILLVRMYSWAILFVVLAFIYFKEAIENLDIKSFILLAVFSVLGAYCHYFAGIVSVVMYLILLAYIINNNKDKIKYWGISVSLGIILYLPWLIILLNQLATVRNSYWIPKVTLDTAIKSFGYFAGGNDTLFSIIAMLVLIIICLIYHKESKNLEKKDQFYILSGIGVYLGTIILAIIISLVYKPILQVRYLLPATAILWFAISIIISKIENKKMFTYAIGLLILLLLAGTANMITTSESIYQTGLAQKEILNEISQDNNSVLIVTTPNMMMYFLDYSNQTDMYCTNVSYLFGDSIDRIHKIFDFKDINNEDIDDFVANNTNKNIYFISWGDLDVNVTSNELFKERGIVFSKVNATAYQNQTKNENTYY